MNLSELAQLKPTPPPVSPSPVLPSLSKMQEKAEETISAEVKRIVSMPIIKRLTPEEVKLVSEFYLDPIEAPRHGFKSLLPNQAEAFRAYNDYHGAFMPIAVGGGKTLAGVGIANDAFRMYGHKKIVMIVPSSLVNQLVDTDIPVFRKIIQNFNLHVHVLPGCSVHKRKALAKSGRFGLYIFSYELLSRAGGLETLEAIAPSCLICDEAHNIAGLRKSARAKRFWEYVDKHNPQVVAMSGTITKKSPADYHRISRACLKENNFLPNASMLAEAWGSLIDSNASSLSEYRNDDRPKAGPIMPLVGWARQNFPDDNEVRENLVGFRRSFKHRLQTAPGVVCSGDDELGISLSLENNPVPEYKEAAGWDKVEYLVEKLHNEWLTPNGDEIEHAMHIWKWRYEIEGSGFYNELFWPEVEKLSERKRITAGEARILLDRSIEYHNRHNDYARTLRAWLGNRSAQGLDSPMLVGKDMSVHGPKNVGALLFDTWQYMKDGDFEGRIDRDGRAVRVSPFKVDHCAAFVKQLKDDHKKDGGIVWVHHQEMGRWVCEKLEALGIEYCYCPAGAQFNAKILDPANSKKVIVASMRAHGTGKNLQAFAWEYYLQWSRDAQLAEQTLGRIHRNGQKRERVKAYLCNTTEFDNVTFSATLNDSCYIHQSTGNKQRLMYADYGFKPKLVPYTVMQEWGTMARKLDHNSAGMLLGKFNIENI